ncbi:hypothetical protein A2661_00885 [Candidatus Giovannonibacteria bacterium RIFCSPHIGHO2_01_FULL_45_24]|nr:MAG: hypothetical protein A2661_00885 [Candidatus Giovannonibacteria bacterium RIFCSPHIGHO2_01_FULL_45_24]
MYKVVLLRKNGQREFFISAGKPTVKHNRNHTEIRGRSLARRPFILIVSQHDSAKIEFVVN